MKEIEAKEFARRLKLSVDKNDTRFSFFLGAGCSISSGKLAAGTLVNMWLPMLKQLKTGTEDNWETWVREVFKNYDCTNPALCYVQVINELFFIL